MESYKIEHLTFTYPNQAVPAVDDLSLSVSQGEFITLCGKSGCGKSTLLRQLKPIISPHGEKKGSVLFMGKPVSDMDVREQSSQIGFVSQSPENQAVTDKVWHEMAFGLESLGLSSAEIRVRVAETASFFGIQTWFHKKTAELSGGQKQLLNLASVMVMQPSVLILDEPTGQLDPIAAREFLETVAKINRDLGTTVILTEHSLEEAFAVSNRILVMDSGKIIADGPAREAGEFLARTRHDMRGALPAPMRIYAGIKNNLECPVTVCDGRKWLETVTKETGIVQADFQSDESDCKQEPMIELRDLRYRYNKDLPDVIKGLSAKIYGGELYAIVGGNGTGKTTALSVISGLLAPYSGEVLINGEKLNKIRNKYNGLLGVLPQNPQTLFVKKTVMLDLYEILSESGLSENEKSERVSHVIKTCGLEGLEDRHPYDLSGGEQQRAAIAKILLLNPRILLLDEPTKGLDAGFKKTLAAVLMGIKASGAAIIMVSHDIEFCAEYADRCAMFFDGTIVSEDRPREFFSGKSFYTTSANRMARGILPKAILAEDVIRSCGGTVEEAETDIVNRVELYQGKENEKEIKPKKNIKITWKNIICGCVFGILFILTNIFFGNKFDDWRSCITQAVTILELALFLANIIPQKRLGAVSEQIPEKKRKMSRRTVISMLAAPAAIFLTVFMGVHYLQEKKYYFISLLIILESFIPFCIGFEGRKPQARELVVISVLCAAAVAGRTAFFMLPQFKPAAAVVIIAGVCLGGETGFLVGAVTGFVSNFFLGQGPWTPWQMISFAFIGLCAGTFFERGLLRKTKGSIVIFGGLAVLVIYGGIMNPASVLMRQSEPNKEMILASYMVGLPFDLIHAVSTMFFLWLLASPMIEKLDRIKVKYGIYS